MLKVIKITMTVLFLAAIAAGPMACLSINSPPDNEPRTEVNVGGEHGVTVEHK